MILKDSQRREIEVVALDGEIGEGAWIVNAGYIDSDDDVSDDTLDYLNDTYQAEIYDCFYQNQVMAAEYACEGDR